MAFIKLRLPVLRRERGLTQRQLATLTGLRADTVSALERGEASAIRFDTLARLCEALKCEPGDLLELESDGHSVPTLAGPDEDRLLLERLAQGGSRIDGPSFLQTLLEHGGK